MSEEDIVALRQAIDEFNRGDMQAVAARFSDDSEWDWSRSIGPDKAVYRGPEEILSFLEEFSSGFEQIRMEIEDVVEVSDRLVAAMLSVMRGRGGIEVEARNAWLITFADGKLGRLEMFQTKAEALEAAGLSE